MVTKLTLGEVTVAQLKLAAVILATDPREPAYRQLLWSPKLPQTSRCPVNTQQEGTVHVELNSTQPPDLQRLLNLVDAAKGGLSQVGRNLRFDQQASGAT
jgi:hypothetical protein